MSKHWELHPRVVELHDRYGWRLEVLIFLSALGVGADVAVLSWLAMASVEWALLIGLWAFSLAFALIWPLLVRLGLRSGGVV